MIPLDLLDLVSGIYDAAFDADVWSVTLLRIADAIGGAQVMMGVHDFKTRSLNAIAPRMDPEHMQSYALQWGASDILWQRTNQVPVGVIVQAEDFVTRDELKHTEIYNEWYRPMCLGPAGLGVNLPTANGLPAICGIKRLVNDEGFSADDIAIFSALAPHLIRAATINQRLWDLNLAEAFVGGEINSLRYGVIVVDAQLRIVFSNEIANGLMNHLGGLSLVSGALSTTDQYSTNELRRLIHTCTHTASLNRGGSLFVTRKIGSPLQLVVTPFPDRQRGVNKLWHIAATPVAIILIKDPELKKQALKQRLQIQYGLTAAEADLTIEIFKGDGREAAALRLAISPGTARIHLQRVFHKTGVHRQAELVRIVSNLTKDELE